MDSLSSNYQEIIEIEHLSPTQKSTLPTETNQSIDPLREFVGAVDRGSLAANLDNELYGS